MRANALQATAKTGPRLSRWTSMTMTPEELKEARTYAWGYFVLHADQRMKLFNFFLILSGLILGAFPAVRGMAPGTKLVGLLPLLLVLSAFTFWRLDERTRHLVKNAEAALRFLDGLWPTEPLADGSPHYVRLIERDDYLTGITQKKWWAKRVVPISYTDNFRIAYYDDWRGRGRARGVGLDRVMSNEGMHPAGQKPGGG